LGDLKKLYVKNRENIVNYIDRTQIDNNIIEAQKSKRGSFTDSHVTRINSRILHAFYYGLSSVHIRTLVEKWNDLSSIEMYEMVKETNQQHEIRYESQQTYTSSRRFRWYESPIRLSEGRMGRSMKWLQSAEFTRTILWCTHISRSMRFRQ